MSDMSENETVVEIAPGISKLVRDLGPDELEAALLLSAIRRARADAGMTNWLNGEPVKCDLRGLDGVYCMNDAAWVINLDPDDDPVQLARQLPPIPVWLCDKHWADGYRPAPPLTA
jgi:hypothetical protein